MARRVWIVVLVALVWTSAAGAVVLRPDRPNSGEYFVPGQLLVAVQQGVPPGWVHAAMGASPRHSIAQIGVDVVDLPPGISVAAGLAAYRQHPGVAWAEPNFYAEAAVVPDDPLFSSQWGLAKVRGPSAWDISVGSPWPAIAIIDTGVDPAHPDLGVKVLPGWNFISNNSNTVDDNGHGTHVAGIVAAVSNNLNGVAGMAWQNPILPVKVLDASGRGSYDAVANGVIYAADHGAAVINMSLGGLYSSTTLEQACQYAYAKGVAVFAASGNNASSVCSYPAAYPTVIAVGATNENDDKAYFSNYGRQLSVMAPGVDILSTLPTVPVTLNTSYGYATMYDSLSGTSMACPHAAGLAALLLSVNPYLGPGGVRHLMERTALDLGELGWDERFGYGRIQADAALEEVLNPATPDSVAPTVNLLTPAAGQTLSGPSLVTISAYDNVGVSRVEYFVDGVLRKTGGVQWLWQTGEDLNGDHTLSAKVSDYAGNSTISTVVASVYNQTITEKFSGSLRTAYVLYPFSTGMQGRIKAALSWSKGASLQLLILYPNNATAAQTGPIKGGSCSLETILPAGQYRAQICLLSGKTSYTLSITHP